MTRVSRRTEAGAACVALVGLACMAAVTGPSGWGSARALGPAAGSQTAASVNQKTLVLPRTGRLDAIKVVAVLESGNYVAPAPLTVEELHKWFAWPGHVMRGGPAPFIIYQFEAGGDWLKNLSLVVKNRTSKTITYASLHESFPETQAAGGQLIFHETRFGAVPAGVPFFGAGQRDALGPGPPLQLGPGAQQTFSLAGDAAAMAGLFNDQQPFSGISVIYVNVDLWFSDGMHWQKGRYAVPDPDRPGHQKPMPSLYFPGPPVDAPVSPGH